MTSQFLEFIRQEIRLATSDLQREQVGQLAAFEMHPVTDPTKHRRQRRTEVDGNGRTVIIPSDPVPGIETRAKRTPAPPIVPQLFTTASWRRAMLLMENPKGAWLRYAYTGVVNYDDQRILIEWLWRELGDWIGPRRFAVKVRSRFKALLMLAMQDVKAELNGRDIYGPTHLSQLVGANVKGWHKTYEPAWVTLRDLLTILDRDALYAISRQRAHTRHENRERYLAKLDKTS